MNETIPPSALVWAGGAMLSVILALIGAVYKSLLARDRIMERDIQDLQEASKNPLVYTSASRLDDIEKRIEPFPGSIWVKPFWSADRMGGESG